MSNPEQHCVVKIYEVNNCLVDLSLKEIVYEDEAFRPDKNVFDTLIYLIENRDHVVGLEEFRNSLWNDRDASEFEIVRCVMKARQAIRDNQDNPLIAYIADLPGYRFTGEVLELEIN